MNPSGEGEAVAVWNSLSFERTGLVTLPEDFRQRRIYLPIRQILNNLLMIYLSTFPAKYDIMRGKWACFEI